MKNTEICFPILIGNVPRAAIMNKHIFDADPAPNICKLIQDELTYPPVPGEGPILTVLPDPAGIIVARYPDDETYTLWILRNTSSQWELYPWQQH